MKIIKRDRFGRSGRCVEERCFEERYSGGRCGGDRSYGGRCGGVRRNKAGLKRLGIVLSVAGLSLPAGFSSLAAQTDAPVNPLFDLPLLLNPAQCGLARETFDPLFSYREPERALSHSFRLNYKNQCSSAFANSSLRILSASYEMRFFQKRMALGVHLYSNTLNASSLQDLTAAFTYAYHWDIATDMRGMPLHRLSFGLQAGYRNWGYSPDQIQTGSMYDPAYTGGYNPGLRPTDGLPDNRHMFDGHFGLQYSGLFAQRWRLNAGAALFHMFRPKSGIIEEDQRVPLRIQAHADAVFMLSPRYMAASHGSELGFVFYYSYQAEEFSLQRPSTFQAGVTYRYLFDEDLSLGAGFLFRTERTFIPQVVLDVRRFTLRLQVELNANYSYNNLFAIGLAYRW